MVEKLRIGFRDKKGTFRYLFLNEAYLNVALENFWCQVLEDF